MQTIPYELIHIIYNYLYKPLDIIRLSLTCKYLCTYVPLEQVRILNIRRQYISINNAINNIRYFVTKNLETSWYTQRSLRIGDRAVLYIYGVYETRTVDKNLYVQSGTTLFMDIMGKMSTHIKTARNISEWNIGHFANDASNIINILNERGIPYSNSGTHWR